MAERIMQLVQVIGSQLPAPSQEPDRYLQPRQAQYRPPTNYEDLLGDAIERTFAAGVHDLAGLVESLNRQGMTTRAGERWTEENYGPEIAALSR
ncbi:recombinase-like helix-turn-helix domain-containing protein [Xenophilus sp. Marseille-Q4582]|uniref:recombinase-like helix-turn-helix domain-containing protein n=1 Tax=Xenophilus sp. Marseille-Q4582 TaxID=2866600 RepID=UPI00351DA119